MATERDRPTPPAKDNRWKLVEATMRRHGHRAHSLIEALHTAQEAYGYLEPQVLGQLARDLRVPLSKVYGVATFYHLFTLKPKGRHACVVCTGTACYIKGAGALVERLQEHYDINPGETTEDDRLSLLTARCVGACGLAPAIVIDGDVLGKLDSESLISKLEELG